MINKAYFISNVYAGLTFKPYTVTDWFDFSEPTSPAPLTGDFTYNGEFYNVVISGNKIYVIKLTGEFDWFTVTAREVSVKPRNLPKP